MANDDQARLVESLTDDMINLLRARLSEALGPKSGDMARDEIAARFEKTLEALQDDATSIDNVEVVVHRLRKRLDDCGVRISTLRGLGYMLEATA